MKTTWKTIAVTAAMGATALTAVTPAHARPYDHRDDRAALAIGAGILGLAVGAALADRDDRHYYDRRYYGTRRYVTLESRPGYYYYYPDRPRVYYQDRYYDRYYAPYARERWHRAPRDGGPGRDGPWHDPRPGGWDRPDDRDWRHP